MDRRHLNKLKFHLAKVLEQPNDEDWTRVIEVLDALAGQVADARSAVVAKLLVNDEALLRQRLFPSDVQRLLHELEQATKREASSDGKPLSDEERVRAVLRGRAMLVIGGEPRQEAEQRLRDSFKLAHLHWPVTREGAPDVYSLEPLIARPDVVVVVLLVRWSRHALNEVAALCDRHGKPLVRETRGYNPVQIASSILEQCGKRLGA